MCGVRYSRIILSWLGKVLERCELWCGFVNLCERLLLYEVVIIYKKNVVNVNEWEIWSDLYVILWILYVFWSGNCVWLVFDWFFSK